MVKRYSVFLFPMLFSILRIGISLAEGRYLNWLYSGLVEIGYEDFALSAIYPQIETTHWKTMTGFEANSDLYLLALASQALIFMLVALLVRFLNKKRPIIKIINKIILTILCYAVGFAGGVLIFGIAANRLSRGFALPILRPDFNMLLPVHPIGTSLTMLKMPNNFFFLGFLGVFLELYTLYVIWVILTSERNLLKV